MKCVHFAIHCKIVGHYSFVILVQILFFPFPSVNLHSFSPVYFIETIRTSFLPKRNSWFQKTSLGIPCMQKIKKEVRKMIYRLYVLYLSSFHRILI